MDILKKKKIAVALLLCLGIVSGLLFYCVKSEKNPSSTRWEDDFKWFNVTVKDKAGRPLQIELGIPLRDIDFTKSRRDSSRATPLSPLCNLHWVANQKNVKELKPFSLQQFDQPTGDELRLLEAVCFDRKRLRNSLTLFSPSERDILWCVAVIKSQNLCKIMKRTSNFESPDKFLDGSSFVRKCDDGKWKLSRSTGILDEIPTILWYYDDYKTLQDCWRAARGEPFPQNYQEYVSRKAKK